MGPIVFMLSDSRRKSEEGKGLAAKITALVNETISAEANAGPNSLSQDDVLALIDSGNSQGGSEGFHWVLDPIDGTRGFVGMRQYAVCLGLLHHGKVRSLECLLTINVCSSCAKHSVLQPSMPALSHQLQCLACFGLNHLRLYSADKKDRNVLNRAQPALQVN